MFLVVAGLGQGDLGGGGAALGFFAGVARFAELLPQFDECRFALLSFLLGLLSKLLSQLGELFR